MSWWLYPYIAQHSFPSSATSYFWGSPKPHGHSIWASKQACEFQPLLCLHQALSCLHLHPLGHPAATRLRVPAGRKKGLLLALISFSAAGTSSLTKLSRILTRLSNMKHRPSSLNSPLPPPLGLIQMPFFPHLWKKDHLSRWGQEIPLGRGKCRGEGDVSPPVVAS